MEILKKYAHIIVILTVVAFCLYLYSKSSSLKTQKSNTLENVEMLADCVPAFQDGGGPYYKPNAPFRSKLAPENHNGESLTVEGKVLKSDCTTPVSNAVLDIWQANESGNYEDIWYRGKVRTGVDGSYSFETVVPKGYGEGTGYRPPHIHFKIFVNNKEIITSQMFFPETRGRQGFDDAFIMEVQSTVQGGNKTHFGLHDIILP